MLGMWRTSMFRKLTIAASLALSLALCFLAFYSIWRTAYIQCELSSHTTAYFAVFDGVLRIGWITGESPMRVLPSMQLDERWTYRHFNFKLLDSGDWCPGPSFGSAMQLRDQRLPIHEIEWRRKDTYYFRAASTKSKKGFTFYQSQIRTWSGTPAIIFAFWPLVALVRGPIRRRYRRRRGLCPGCGYNLAGNVTGVCPECGTPGSVCAQR